MSATGIAARERPDGRSLLNAAGVVGVELVRAVRVRDRQQGVFGGGAYCQVSGSDGDTQFVYYCGGDGPLTAFTLDNGTLSAASRTAEALGSGTPIVSSNGTAAGTGIVWMICS